MMKSLWTEPNIIWLGWYWWNDSPAVIARLCMKGFLE